MNQHKKPIFAEVLEVDNNGLVVLTKEQLQNPQLVVYAETLNANLAYVRSVLGERTAPVVIINDDTNVLDLEVVRGAIGRKSALTIVRPDIDIFDEVVPKKEPKTYGPPRLGERGKKLKW